MKKFSRVLFVLLLSMNISGCATLDIKPWTLDDVVDNIILSSITGNRVSRGNRSQCNQIKMQCSASNYTEQTINGELRCSCRG